MPDDTGFGAHKPGWDGTTYYGREQVKAAPFNNWLVGGYIFLAGLSGGTMLLSSIMDLTRGRAAARGVARGRYLSMIGPTLGAALLVMDLHTPKRFYNMLRLFKSTSPMSIGSWILVAFGVFSGATTAAHWASTHVPGLRWLRFAAKALQVPAALTGAGIATYTASLLSATSTPLWAAAPHATAVRFGASSLATGAAALSLGEPARSRIGRNLDQMAVAALALELAATVSADEQYRRKGVDGALRTLPGFFQEVGASGFGVLVPLGLHALSLAFLPRRSRILSRLASAAALTGSAILRVSFMAAGDESARRPEISFRFTQPDNLPRAR